MIPGFIGMLIAGIVACQPAEVLLTEPQMIHLVFQNDACAEQGFLEERVALCLLFCSEGYLCQIIVALMRIGSDGVRRGEGAFLIHGGVRILLVLLIFRGVSLQTDNGLVDALPVVDILAFAPLALEGGLSLTRNTIARCPPKA